MAEATPPQVYEAPESGQTLYPHNHPSHPQHPRKPRTFWQKHSLSITSITIVTIWIVAYVHSDPSTHIGGFFGNAIADWAGVVVTVLATKWLYEKGSAESRKTPTFFGNPLWCKFREHSLSVFLLVTGIGWVLLFAHMDANSKWGQVVGNIVSEWTQIFGTVLLTKKLIEWKSKE
jgi:hypothetical protein